MSQSTTLNRIVKRNLDGSIIYQPMKYLAYTIHQPQEQFNSMASHLKKELEGGRS